VVLVMDELHRNGIALFGWIVGRVGIGLSGDYRAA
jgi:hypothetical protein